MFALSLAAALATVQPAPADEEEIVIEAELPEDEKKEVRRVVRALIDVPSLGQIPRFHNAICPYAVGLPKAQVDGVVERIRQVADATFMGAAEKPCNANLMIVVTDDRRALFETWLDNHPRIFFGYEPADIRRIRDAEGPVTSWQIVMQADRDLEPLPIDFADGYTINESIESPSRIRNVRRPDVRAAIIVFDREAVAGLTTTQLADYALMRATTKMDDDAVDALQTPSILQMFADLETDGEALRSVSEYDVGFLEALHSTDNLRNASQQRAAMRYRMEQAISRQRREAEEAEEAAE